MTEVKAHNRHLSMSPRKVRIVVDVIRGMDAEPALAQLTYMSKAAARPVRKLLESAIANAKHNNKLNVDNLFVKAIMVNQGPTIKRFRPRAMGASATILKRTSHVTVVLAPKVEPKPVAGKPEKKEEKTEKAVKTEKKEEEKKASEKAKKKKPVTKKSAPKKGLTASAKSKKDSVKSDAVTPESSKDIRGTKKPTKK